MNLSSERTLLAILRSPPVAVIPPAPSKEYVPASKIPEVMVNMLVIEISLARVRVPANLLTVMSKNIVDDIPLMTCAPVPLKITLPVPGVKTSSF